MRKKERPPSREENLRVQLDALKATLENLNKEWAMANAMSQSADRDEITNGLLELRAHVIKKIAEVGREIAFGPATDISNGVAPEVPSSETPEVQKLHSLIQEMDQEIGKLAPSKTDRERKRIEELERRKTLFQDILNLAKDSHRDLVQ